MEPWNRGIGRQAADGFGGATGACEPGEHAHGSGRLPRPDQRCRTPKARRGAALASPGEDERARRFHEAALPHLNDVYTLARYLMRNLDDAEDAVQECYLRGLRYFDSYRGPAMKPWLLAILRNVFMSEFARRGKQEPLTESADDRSDEQMAVWQESQASPEGVLIRQHEDATIRRLVAACRRRSARSSCCAR